MRILFSVMLLCAVALFAAAHFTPTAHNEHRVLTAACCFDPPPCPDPLNPLCDAPPGDPPTPPSRPCPPTCQDCCGKYEDESVKPPAAVGLTLLMMLTS